MEDQEEYRLLLRLKQDDEAAFRVLYDRYSRLMYANIRRLVSAEEVAEDLLQDVFVKIWEHREAIDPQRSFKAYLFTISRHFAFNFKRRLKLEVAAALQLAEEWEEGREPVGELLQAKETESLFHAAIDLLPPQRKRIYQLCKLEGMSYQEVADLLNISPSTVRDHLVKANKLIRERLAKGQDFPTMLLTIWLTSGLS